MGAFIAQKLIKMLVAAKRPLNGAKIGILGLTFKENVPDLRNSRVPDIIKELRQFGIEPLIHDPLASAEEALEEYDVSISSLSDFADLDALVLAVPHEEYVNNLGRRSLVSPRADYHRCEVCDRQERACVLRMRDLESLMSKIFVTVPPGLSAFTRLVASLKEERQLLGMTL